ncbi:hypothetical protein [Streptomyces sp. TRM64462]|uniref:hypothetical protein n=1 Tax=Streptomyces sp. TRM64462 TaxID=2741726 RepID=UPI001586D93C|nr:hypothetical protein [Streptomyces sp. TRM64462]
MFRAGVGFYALFGFGWWLLGASATSGGARIAVMIVGGAVAVGLMVAARRLLPASAGGPPPPDRRRRFFQINAAQWVLIAGVAVACGTLGVPELVAPLIALVVGLHFLPLAAVFAQPALRVPAALMSTVGVAGAAVALGGGSGESVRLMVGGLSALSLWGTAVRTVAAAAAAGAVSSGP